MANDFHRLGALSSHAFGFRFVSYLTLGLEKQESGGGGLGGMMKRSGSSSLAKSVIAKHAARQNTQKSVKTTPSMGPLGLMLYIMFSPYYLLAWLLVRAHDIIECRYTVSVVKK